MQKPRGMRNEQWEKLSIVYAYFEQYIGVPVKISFPTLKSEIYTTIKELKHQKVSDSDWKEVDENGKSKQQFLLVLHGNEKLVFNIDDLTYSIYDFVLYVANADNTLMVITRV